MSKPTSFATSHIRKLSHNLMSVTQDQRAARQKSTKPTGNMDIIVDGHFSAKVYTSGSTISGYVVVNSPRDVAFDEFEILFTGTSYTRVDFVNQYATFSARPFMKLRMPMRASDFPNPRVFKAGRTYTIPFNFVVPHQLTLGACSHACVSPNVCEQHLRLPPSMGYWEDNDQAPEMAQIEYAIHARAFQDTKEHGKIIPLEGQQLLKVLPSRPEDAPLDITAKDERYHLSKTKTIRKNLFSAKSGKITATATQPSAIMLSADAHRVSESSLRINLDFNPATAEAVPPKINSVTAKLHATTFFSSAPMDILPNLGSRVTYRTNPSLTYSTTNPLVTAPLETVSWAHETARRDSGYSSSPEQDGSDSDTSHGRHNKKSTKPSMHHVATVDIPFTLPTAGKKFFLPSFHNCLISRAYVVHLNISTGPMNTSISLAVPLQVAVENIHEPPQVDDLPSFETAMAQMEEEDADMHLQPRLLQVPSARYQNTSALPGYEDLSRRTVAVA
ncbi:Fc.00g087300.m01.CDS01 [Cosmosporella sp. VM-42]